MLQLSYDGSFTVISRNDKNFTIHICDKNTSISTDRTEPAYLFSDLLTNVWETSNNSSKIKQIQEAHNEDNERVIDQRKNKNSSIPGGNGVLKTTYRRIRFREEFKRGT